MEKKEITLTLSMEEVQLIFNGLGELKAGLVFSLLNKIQFQIQPQLREEEKKTEVK